MAISNPHRMFATSMKTGLGLRQDGSGKPRRLRNPEEEDQSHCEVAPDRAERPCRRMRRIEATGESGPVSGGTGRQREQGRRCRPQEVKALWLTGTGVPLQCVPIHSAALPWDRPAQRGGRGWRRLRARPCSTSPQRRRRSSGRAPGHRRPGSTPSDPSRLRP
jgi:hypothetical protein